MLSVEISYIKLYKVQILQAESFNSKRRLLTAKFITLYRVQIHHKVVHIIRLKFLRVVTKIYEYFIYYGAKILDFISCGNDILNRMLKVITGKI